MDFFIFFFKCTLLAAEISKRLLAMLIWKLKSLEITQLENFTQDSCYRKCPKLYPLP